jgi:PAS domain S-box-containing protein
LRLEASEERLLRSVALQNAAAILRAQERAERDLAAANERIAQILDTITDGFIVLDRDLRFTYVNRHAAAVMKTTGFSREEFIGRDVREVFPRVVGTDLERAYLDAMRDQANTTFERRSEATGRWYEIRLYPTPDSLTIYHRDITQQREAKEQLREREDRLRAIFDHAAVGIAVARLDGTFEEVNRRFADILGHTTAELCALTFAEITHPDELPATAECMRALVSGESADASFEKRYRHRDGGYVWCLVSATVLKDAQGRPHRFLGVIEDVSARRRDQLERERLTSVLERSVNEVYIFDTRTLRFQYVNDGARRNLGYTLAEMTRMTPVDIKPEFTEARFREMIAPLLEGRPREQVFETVHRRRDGTDYPVEVHLQRVVHGDDPVFLAIVLDITERRRAEEELRRNEEQLRALADSIPHLAWIARADGDIFWFNRGWYEYTGTTLAEVAGSGWERVHHEATLPLVKEAWERSLASGEPMEMEFPLRGADGTFRWFLTRANPVRDADGRIVRWFGTNTNVDEVRRSREALREETRLLELLNDTGAAIAAELDLPRLLQKVTDSATKLTGADFGAFFYNATGAEGDEYQLFTLSGAPREAFSRFGHPRATPLFGPTFRGEGIIRSGDVHQDPRYGQWPPHHGMPEKHLPVRSYLAVPVISRGREVIGGLFFGHKERDVFTERHERVVVAVAAQAATAIDNARLYEAAQREIAERAKVEHELRVAKEQVGRHAENLESEVSVRTASLREALTQLEEFSYSVSHDLRAPIRAIAGYAQVLGEDHDHLLDEESRWLLGRIARSADHMARLVDDVLTLSRAASANVELTSIPLAPLVTRIIERHPSMQEPEASVRMELPHAAIGDEALLTQALTNLLSNAVKFVGPGVRPEVAVRSERRDGRVRIVVEDNGIGLRPEHVDKLFGMFQRLPTTSSYEGTGIGLALVRKAAERMGGKAGAEPLAVGSRFWIELGGE